MAADFIDGFDYLTAANLSLKWDSSPGATSLTTGVYGKGKALQFGSQAATKTLPSNKTTGMAGFHAFVASLALSTVVAVLDGGTIQVDLRMDATGALFFTRNGTTIGSTSSFRLTPGQWYWIEIQVTIDPTVGVAKCYVGNTQVLNGTGLNTRATTNSFYNQVRLPGNSSNGTQQYDSFHSWDSSGSGITAFPYGEHVIDTKLATAVGSNTTWTKGGSTINTNNYQQVNEANEDGDTTYVFTSGVNNIDSYGFANLDETSGTIGTIAVNTIDRIDDAGPHVIDHFVKSSAATALGPNVSPGASYVNHQSFFDTDPNTSAAWTISGRNAAEFGYKFLS